MREIKTSKSDLIRDNKKGHKHENEKIRKLYFAIPESLLGEIEHIPERAGIIVVDAGVAAGGIFDGCCRAIREAKINSDYVFTDTEKFNMARLGTMRIWTLKRKIASSNYKTAVEA